MKTTMTLRRLVILVISVCYSKFSVSISPWGVKMNPPKHDSPGSDTRVSQSPQDLITGWVNLPRIWYPGESISLGSDTQVSHSPWGLIPSESISPGSDTRVSHSPWGLIPSESISPGSDTRVSHSPWGLIPWWVNLHDPGASKSPRSLIPQGRELVFSTNLNNSAIS